MRHVLYILSDGFRRDDQLFEMTCGRKILIGVVQACIGMEIGVVVVLWLAHLLANL